MNPNACENDARNGPELVVNGLEHARFMPLRRRQCSASLSRQLLRGISLLSLLPRHCDGYIPFGSDNGYDREGGIEPICWDSVVRTITGGQPQTTEELNLNFDSMNAELYNESLRDVLNLTVRDSCNSRTFLSVTAYFPNDNRNVLTGQPYSFRLDLTFVPQEDTFLATNTNGTTFMRLLLCDALVTGFCSPFINQGTSVGEYSSNADPYSYTSDQILLGERNNGLHLLTRYIRWPLEKSDTGAYNVTLDIRFQVPFGMGGYYFFIGHAIVYSEEETQNNALPVQYRTDIAHALSGNVIYFQEAPEILTITDGFKIAWGVVVGCLLPAEIFVLYQIIKHRAHPVMTLAQAPFLALLTFCGIVVTACSFVFMPINDAFCNLRGVLVEIPLTMMAAILVGRLWRVYTTIAVALKIGGKHQKKMFAGRRTMAFLTGLSRLHLICTEGCERERNDGTLRTKITNADLLRLILILTIPQIILQVIGITMYEIHLEIQFDEEMTIGRLVCEQDERWPLLAGIAYMSVLFMWAVYTAYVTSNLPSVFNEKAAIFNSAAICGAVALLVLSLILIFDDAAALSPNIASLLWLLMMLTIVVCTLIFIVTPKIKRVWSGDKIVISKLLQGSARRSSIIEKPPNRTTGLQGSSAFVASPAGNGAQSRRTIVLNMDDPPPQRIESQLFELNELISEFLEDSMGGRSITLSDWQIMIAAVEKLHGDLEAIEFMWSNEDEVHDATSTSSA